MNKLNSFQLKIIALVIMTIDHIAVYNINVFPPLLYDFFRCAGRSAMPLFMYALIFGAKCTKRKKQFLIRLYVSNIAIFIIWVPFYLFFNGKFAPMPSVLSTYTYVLIYAFLIEKFIEKLKYKKIISLAYMSGIAIITIIPEIVYNSAYDVLINLVTSGSGIFKNNIIYVNIADTFLNTISRPLRNVDGSVYFVIMGVIWYFAKNKYICSGVLILFSLWGILGAYNETFDIIGDFTGNYYTNNLFFSKTQSLMIFAALFILLFNKEKGRAMKYFFYIYYPAHIFVISAVNSLFMMK